MGYIAKNWRGVKDSIHNVIEGKARTAMPEPPTTSLQHFSKEKESMI